MYKNSIQYDTGEVQYQTMEKLFADLVPVAFIATIAYKMTRRRHSTSRSPKRKGKILVYCVISCEIKDGRMSVLGFAGKDDTVRPWFRRKRRRILLSFLLPLGNATVAFKRCGFVVAVGKTQ